MTVPRLPGLGAGLDLPQDALNALRRAAILTAVTVGGTEIVNLVTGKEVFEWPSVPPEVARRITETIGRAERDVGGPLFQALVAASAGVELSDAPGRQEAEAVKMVERMLGFAVTLPFVTSEIHNVIKALLGEHAPEALLKAIEEIPLDLGINFFIGTVIERIFETAVSRPLEEAIAEQKRPARLEWPQIRALARAKALSPDEFVRRLQRAGWRDEDIPLITELDRQLLSVSDLQAAFSFGLRDEQFIRDYLDKLGVSADDADLIINLYVKRTETAGGDQLRAVAQRGYLESHITRDQYAAILSSVNVPAQSANLELAAADLVKSWGQKTLSVAEIKKFRDDGVYDDGQAINRLMAEGYTQNDATALVADWNATRKQALPGLNENRVLTYYVSGILTPEQAYARLLELHIRPIDAHFLIDHPEAGAVVKPHGPGRGTILSALADGIIDVPTAKALLITEGADEESAQLDIEITTYRTQRGRKAKQPNKSLSEAQILQALNLELATSAWATRELVTIGYTDQDALLLVAIEQTKVSKVTPDGWVTLN